MVIAYRDFCITTNIKTSYTTAIEKNRYLWAVICRYWYFIHFWALYYFVNVRVGVGVGKRLGLGRFTICLSRSTGLDGEPVDLADNSPISIWTMIFPLALSSPNNGNHLLISLQPNQSRLKHLLPRLLHGVKAPLPEPILTYHQWGPVKITFGNFTRNTSIIHHWL